MKTSTSKSVYLQTFPSSSMYLTFQVDNLPVGPHEDTKSFSSRQFFHRHLISSHHCFISWWRWLCSNPASLHNTVSFRPCCSSFTADSVLLRISFYIACLLCPFMVPWASENIRSAALLTTTTRLTLRWCSLFPLGLSAFFPKSASVCPLPSWAGVHAEYSASKCS